MAKAHYPHPILAREGWPFIIVTVVASLLITCLFGAWSLPFWLITAFVVQFFRDPARETPNNDANAITSPADGRIVVIEKTQDPYRHCEALKISVFMNVFNVHSNRSPIESTVLQKWYNRGGFFNAALDKASTENERCALHLRTSDDQDVTCVQIAGLVARRILNYVDAGVALAAGQRYGFIRFGSRVDVYLPLDAKVKVVIGERVSASSSILAELN